MTRTVEGATVAAAVETGEIGPAVPLEGERQGSPSDTIVPPEMKPAPKAPLMTDPMVTITRGVQVPMSKVHEMADPRCPDCTQGIVINVRGRKRFATLCGCATRAILREMRGEKPSAPAARVEMTADAAAEQARRAAEKLAKRRERIAGEVADLRAKADEIDAEVAGRIAGHDAGIAEAEEELARVASARAAKKREGEDAQANADAIKLQLDEAVRKASEILSEWWALVLPEKEAEKKLAALRAGSQKVLDSTAGARHKATNLRRQADLLAARNADVLNPADHDANEMPGPSVAESVML